MVAVTSSTCVTCGRTRRRGPPIRACTHNMELLPGRLHGSARLNCRIRGRMQSRVLDGWSLECGTLKGREETHTALTTTAGTGKWRRGAGGGGLGEGGRRHQEAGVEAGGVGEAASRGLYAVPQQKAQPVAALYAVQRPHHPKEPQQLRAAPRHPHQALRNPVPTCTPDGDAAALFRELDPRQPPFVDAQKHAGQHFQRGSRNVAHCSALGCLKLISARHHSCEARLGNTRSAAASTECVRAQGQMYSGARGAPASCRKTARRSRPHRRLAATAAAQMPRRLVCSPSLLPPAPGIARSASQAHRSPPHGDYFVIFLRKVYTIWTALIYHFHPYLISPETIIPA